MGKFHKLKYDPLRKIEDLLTILKISISNLLNVIKFSVYVNN